MSERLGMVSIFFCSIEEFAAFFKTEKIADKYGIN